MTIIRFEYKENYHMPATGGLVFMPHRKHAANETEVLPKPFHKTLVDGVVEVDLEPTGDEWVWSVSLRDDTRFYAIPDHTGIIPHTDLIPIAPSTLDFRVEPSWWAELRQYQQLIVYYVDESRSNVDEAISTVNSVHHDLKTAVSDAQRHESVAGAYSRQAAHHSTHAHTEANRAQKAADEATTGPNSAAQRAETAADEATSQANRSQAEATNSQTAANSAAQHANTAEQQADRAHAIADSWETLNQAIDKATAQATTARDEATRAHTEANRSTTQADIATSQTQQATTQATRAQDEADRAQTIADNLQYGPWVIRDMLNGWEHGPHPLQGRKTPLGYQLTGTINGANATSITFTKIPETPNRATSDIVIDDTGATHRITCGTNRNTEINTPNTTDTIHINIIIPLTTITQ